jgi:hypothetical protein
MAYKGVKNVGADHPAPSRLSADKTWPLYGCHWPHLTVIDLSRTEVLASLIAGGGNDFLRSDLKFYLDKLVEKHTLRCTILAVGRVPLHEYLRCHHFDDSV